MKTSFNYPLLSQLATLYESVKLEDVLLLASQHLLKPQEKMITLLLDMGLKSENCIISGKSYSTNRSVMNNLIAKGCIVAPFSLDFDPLQSFDEWYEYHLNNFIKQQLSHRNFVDYSKVIVLDDGGFLHLIVNSLHENFSNVVGIEQTSSGHHRINDIEICFPSVSVARSLHKIVFESPYIGHDGLKRIVSHIKSRDKGIPKVLVAGLGAIGSQIAGRLFLKHMYDGYAMDPKIDTKALRHQQGAIKLLVHNKRIISVSEAAERLREFDVIVGATGFASFANTNIDDFHEEVSLISISSSDREFPVLEFRRHGGKVHDDYYRGQRCLVNGGFPITFDGESCALPSDQIEFTIALLLSRLFDEVSDGGLQWLAGVIAQILSVWQSGESSSLVQ